MRCEGVYGVRLSVVILVCTDLGTKIFENMVRYVRDMMNEVAGNRAASCNVERVFKEA